MQKLKKSVIALSIIFLTSCQHFEIMCDIGVTSEFERCRCRCVNFKTMKRVRPDLCERDWIKYFDFVPKRETQNYPLFRCDGFTGFHAQEYAEDIIPIIKEERRKCKDNEG